MKNTLLIKVLSLILLAVVLSAALTALAFNYFGRSVFSGMKAKEIEPRVKFVASLTADYMQGNITQSFYRRSIGSEYHIWDASLYVFDATGKLFVYPTNDIHKEENIAATKAVLDKVLEGNSLYTEGTVRSVGVVLGEPVYAQDGAVIGAAFMIKPLKEVSAALVSLTYALIVSMLAAALIMIAPAYFGSRSITKPIYQMIKVADSMACGDFTAHAYDEGKGEIAQLGRALNYLSGALSSTINDLTFERNRLRAVLFGLGEGIIALNANGEVTQFNPSAVRLMRGTIEDSPEALSAYQEILPNMRQVLEDGGSRAREIKCGEATLRFTMTALKQDDESIEGAVTLVQDITETERLEQTRKDYVANVSHELRTPLASIRSLADALNDGMVKSDADKLRYYGYILKESMRLSRLIDDLLELSRLQSGAVALSRQKLDVPDMIYDVADRYTASMREKQLTLDIQMPEPCPCAYTNPDRAEQVLIALLDNAIKHTEGEGALHIGVREDTDKLYISVENPGSIPEADIDHVFERFYKVDHSHSGGGTGLGLAIAREVMLLMKEDIRAQSFDGKVVFTFSLQKLI